jgi:large subunit ribosomal protein L15
MVVHKLKKKVKYRGSKTHGCGSMKKRRGAGHRGGRGAAGSGKRGDAKKPSIWGGRYFGKHGFTSRASKVSSINFKEIEIKLHKLVKKELVKETKGIFDIDLTKLGYDKLLSTGKITKKLNIKVKSFSKKAAEKIKKAGGKLE